MRERSGSCISLHARPYREGGYLVDLYSARDGLVRCVLPGSRVWGRRVVSSLDALTAVWARYSLSADADSLGILEEVEMEWGGRLPRRDPICMAVSLFSRELLLGHLRGYPPSGSVYALLRGYAERVNEPGRDARLAPHWLVLHLACALGYRPGSMGEGTGPHFDLESGRFTDCARGLPRWVSSGIDRLLLAGSFPPDFLETRAERIGLLETLLRYLSLHSRVQGPLRSVRMLGELLY